MDDFKKLDPAQQKQFLFMVLVQQHEQIGMMGLGKIKNPATDKIEKELSQAKFAIDTLEMLEQYTQGNLGKDEKDYLTFVLSNLRLNYVQEAQNG
jgi:hypothetical protein